jgi:hypothetical protein
MLAGRREARFFTSRASITGRGRRLLALAFCLAALAVSGRSAADDETEIVDWHDAARCVGRVCGIRGKVVTVENLGSSIRLHFDSERSGARIILMHGWLVTWPSYEGQTIVATGKVDRFRDHVEMILLDPENIAVLDGAPPSTPSAVASPTPAAPPTPSAPLPTSTVPPATPSAVPASTSTAVLEAAPTAPPAAPPPTAPATPLSETEELRKRVRELEERVRELEGR